MRIPKTGESIIGVVAQQPFEPSSTGVRFSFCTLQPLLFKDGERTERKQFPDNGLVWWMLAPDAHRFAQPGRLVSFVLEPAKEHREGKSVYQARRDSVKPVAQADAVEILTVPSGSLARENDLVGAASCVADHPPCRMVLVRWSGHLYGPLQVVDHSERDLPGAFSVGFANPAPDRRVHRLSDEGLESERFRRDREFEAEISLDAMAREQSDKPFTCRYELVPAEVYERLARGAEQVHVESDAEMLSRASKELLGWNRKQRSEFKSLLDAFANELSGQEPTADVAAVKEVLRRTRSVLARNTEAGDEIAEALLKSGAVDERVEAGIDARHRQYLEDHAATVSADIEKQVGEKRRALDELHRRHDELADEIESKTREAGDRLDREIEESRARHRAEMDEQRAAFDKEKKALDRQQQAVKKRLQTATDRFVSKRDEVVDEVLTLAPLLHRAGLISGASSAPAPAADGAATAPAPADGPAFALRPYLSNPLPGGSLDETAFFERFERHVRESGYVYRRKDLAAFHVSVKVSDLTVLGGVSGTGKSSLPRLYAQALAGEVGGQDRYRMVGVNPSWLDAGDLLGRVNVLDARFLPSDSGLYDLLVHVHEEWRSRAADSGIYVVCLDEMNLAQVEHYFSPFLQVLELPPDRRRLRCFAREAVSPGSQFAAWSALDLPPTLRFVGTVNFDETTRPLSLRVLDRVNLIRLRPGPLAELDLSDARPAEAPVAGPPVTGRVFESWRASGQPGTVAGLLDELRGPLETLGCPLNPRRYRALCRFLASAPKELLTADEALDLQITQRLLPQIRGLFRPEARQAVETLLALLRKRGDRYAESVRALEELSTAEDALG